MNRYSSIFLDKDWAHTKYYGWENSFSSPNLKLWMKPALNGFIKRYILIIDGAEKYEVESLVKEKGLLSPQSIVNVHDFNAKPDSSEIELNGRKLERCNNKGRILNIDTFVVDLTLTEDELWDNMGKVSKNKSAWRQIRKAEKQNLKARFSTEYDKHAFDEFYKNYKRMAEERNLYCFDYSQVANMMKSGNVILHETIGEKSEVLVSLLIYITTDKAFYLYGATAEKIESGMSAFAHWECIKYLKNIGLKFYDLGGVPSTDPQNGIFRFKKSLGGEFFSLGQEFRYIPWPLKILTSLSGK